jgi:AraC family L-rhamnose operon transcriptional activator RhaR
MRNLSWNPLRASALSPRSVRDAFKQITGATISRCQMQRRLCRAITLLGTSELSIAEVAAERL